MRSESRRRTCTTTPFEFPVSPAARRTCRWGTRSKWASRRRTTAHWEVRSALTEGRYQVELGSRTAPRRTCG